MAHRARPSVVALAGPNGAGKSTAGPGLLRDTLEISEFVNADVIAHGLSAFDPEGAAIAAGRIMLSRLRELSERKVNFAFETTLAGRTYEHRIQELRRHSYSFHVVFLWLGSPDLAVSRVEQRVALGGHAVPEKTIRRRYDAGLKNFFGIYQRLAKTWRFYDNSGRKPLLLAEGSGRKIHAVYDKATWEKIRQDVKA